VDRTVDFLKTAIGVLLGAAHGLLDFAAAFDDDLAFDGVHGKDRATLAFVVAGDDFDFVAFFDVTLHGKRRGWK
jgi:hypothetical protein